jgi:hypothetical protein
MFRLKHHSLTSSIPATGTSNSPQKRTSIRQLLLQPTGTEGKSIVPLRPSYLSHSQQDSGVIPKILVSSRVFIHSLRFNFHFQESNTARPSFRTSLTQPSQMGNFRHQSTRTSDRDRDKDTEKEKDRDRDAKDGQDRLRSVGLPFVRKISYSHNHPAFRQI